MAVNDMEVVNIPLKDIDADDEFNCRGKIAPIDVRDLAQNIEEQGLLQPGVVTEHPNPDNACKWKLIAGFRRNFAIKLLKWKSMPCVVMHGISDADARIFNLNENIQRQELDMRQEALAVQKIEEIEPDLNRDDLANRLGKSSGWIQVRKMFLDLPEPVQDEVVVGMINQTQIRELYSVQKHEGNDKVFERVKEIKEAKKNGKAPSQKPRENKDTKRQRKRNEIFGMMEYVSNYIPFHIEGHSQLWSRTMAWCAGEISDKDFYDSCHKHADKLGLEWSDPSN